MIDKAFECSDDDNDVIEFSSTAIHDKPLTYIEVTEEGTKKGVLLSCEQMIELRDALNEAFPLEDNKDG